MLHSQRIRVSALAVGRVAVFSVVAVAFALGFASGAQAQITTEVLIGDSVSDLGPRYSDVDEAIKRFVNRDVLGARQFLEAALRKNPNLPPVDMLLAKMSFLAGDSASGLVALEKTASDNPNDPEPFLILADQAILQGQTIPAEALYEKAIELLGKYDGNAKRKRSLTIRAYSGRSLVAERRKNWPLAAADLTALLKLDPDNANAHFRLGRSLFMQSKFQEGIAEFAKANQLDKNLPNASVSSALLYEQLGKRDEAKTAFESAVKTDRNDIKTITAYAQWLLQTGDVGKAKSALAAGRRLEPENLELLILSGAAARMAKETGPAEDYFVAALRLSPSNSAVINQLALLLVDTPDDEKRQRALEFARINALLQPNSAESNISLAWVLYQLGNNRDAEAALRKGLQAGNPSPDSNYLIAKILVDQNKQDVAKQFLNYALENSSGSLFLLRDDAVKLQEQIGK